MEDNDDLNEETPEALDARLPELNPWESSLCGLIEASGLTPVRFKSPDILSECVGVETNDPIRTIALMLQSAMKVGPYKTFGNGKPRVIPENTQEWWDDAHDHQHSAARTVEFALKWARMNKENTILYFPNNGQVQTREEHEAELLRRRTQVNPSEE